MLHFVYRLMANFVSLPFGAGQIVHSWLLELFDENTCLLRLKMKLKSGESKPKQGHKNHNNYLTDTKTL